MQDAHRPVSTSRSTPAISLALVLLLAFGLGGFLAFQTIRMVPGTSAHTVSTNHSNTPQNLQTATPDRPRPLFAGPGWGVMTRSQKLALYPLAERWDYMTESQKRRWLALATTFPGMPENEQQRLRERMTAWASLSAQQRSQARLNFATTRALSPVDIQSEWEAYQALSDARKKSLAANAPKPRGAATALRPLPSKQLAHVPTPSEAQAAAPNAPKVIVPQATPVRAPSAADPVPLPQAMPLLVMPPYGPSRGESGMPPDNKAPAFTPPDPLPDPYMN